MMTKEEAISILKSNGWIINRPEEIEVTETEEDTIYLRQEGNGEWIITATGSVTFFEDENESPQCAWCGEMSHEFSCEPNSDGEYLVLCAKCRENRMHEKYDAVSYSAQLMPK